MKLNSSSSIRGVGRLTLVAIAGCGGEGLDGEPPIDEAALQSSSVTLTGCPSALAATISAAVSGAANAYGTLTGLRNCDTGVTVKCVDSASFNGWADRATCSIGIYFPFAKATASQLKFVAAHEIEHLWAGGTASSYKERCADGAALYYTASWPIQGNGTVVAPCSYALSSSKLCSTEQLGGCEKTSRAIFWGRKPALLAECMNKKPLATCGYK